MAENRFGKNNPPKSIILTHGHFDHVGSIVGLLKKWHVPVYAHPLETPYLTGVQGYPEPDTTVEGGMLAKISSIYPHEPIDITEALHSLPLDGSVPHLNDWQWIHVPGHSPGQIALFKAKDKIIISADAIITVKQDSMYRVLIQKEEVCGPPVYLTTDWNAAFESAKKIVDLNPEILVPGHGTALKGEALKQGLKHLISDWNAASLPAHGKWVKKNEINSR